MVVEWAVVRNKGAMRGTLRKRSLFGPEGHDTVPSVSDVAEAQTGWPPDDEYPEEARSPRVDLADVVAHLQKEVEEFRSESGYGGSRGSATPPPQPSGWSRFTSTHVPMFAVKTNWDQYLQVFETIVSSNGWDGGGAIACVSPRRRRPQHGPAGAGTPWESFVRCADGAL